MGEREPRPPAESGEPEKIRDPKRILELLDKYRKVVGEWKPLREKELEALDNGTFNIYMKEYHPRAKQLAAEFGEIQAQVPLDLHSLDKQLTDETPEWNYKYWIIKPKIDEQVRQAGSKHAWPKYPNFELQSEVIALVLREKGFDIEGGLEEYNWTPGLVNARDNLKRFYGDEAERASDYVLINHELTEIADSN